MLLPDLHLELCDKHSQLLRLRAPSTFDLDTPVFALNTRLLAEGGAEEEKGRRVYEGVVVLVWLGEGDLVCPWRG